MAVEIIPVRREHLESLHREMFNGFLERTKTHFLFSKLGPKVQEREAKAKTRKHFSYALQALKNPGDIFLIAIEEGKIVGFASGEHAPEYIRPGYRRIAESKYICSFKLPQGIGSALLKKQLQLMLENNAEVVILEPIHAVSARMVRTVARKMGLRVHEKPRGNWKLERR